MNATPRRKDASPSLPRRLRIDAALETATAQIACWLRDEAGRSRTELAARVHRSFDEFQRRGPAPSVAAVAQAISGRDWPETIRAGARPPLSSPLLAGLPAEAMAFCEAALRRLSIPDAFLDAYLQRIVGEIFDALAMRSPSAAPAPESRALLEARELLANRLAWDLLLLRDYATAGAELAWRRAINEAARYDDGGQGSRSSQGTSETPWHGQQHRLLGALRTPASSSAASSDRRHQDALVAWVAAPVDLLGRAEAVGGCERHGYDWRADRGFVELEALMTGPLLDATAHHLRALLAGREPGPATAPLCAVLAAPITAINAVLEKHAALAAAAETGWLNLFAAYDDAAVILRYTGNLHWDAMSGQDAA